MTHKLTFEDCESINFAILTIKAAMIQLRNPRILKKLEQRVRRLEKVQRICLEIASQGMLDIVLSTDTKS